SDEETDSQRSNECLAVIEKTPVETPTATTPTLEDLIEDGRELMKMFINDAMSDVYPRLMAKQHTSLIHALGVGALRFFEALLTLDKSKLDEALQALRHSADFADGFRKKSYTSFLFGSNYDQYTDEECFAELCYAKSLLLAGLVSVLVDQTVYSFINAALNIRSAYQSYKECVNILKFKGKWESSAIRMHFESGTRLGVGGFDLTISFFPSKLAKLLEFVGFNGDRNVALDELSQSAALVDGLLYDISSIALSAYHGFIEYFYGLGEGDVTFFDMSSKTWLSRTPDSSIVKLGLGLREQITGNPDNAINYYLQCVDGQKHWVQLHNACYWKITWCHALKCDWENAAKYAKLLKDDCKWSPAMFSYLYAIFQYMVMSEHKRYELKDEIADTLYKLPSLKRRLGGKRAFHEKLVIERSKKFHNQLENFILPPFEVMYIWNFFNMMNGNEQLINPFLERVEQKLKEHKSDKDEKKRNLDTYCNLVFMKSVLLKQLDSLHDALDGFNEVLNCKKRIHDETHLLPQSSYEIGLIYRKMGKLTEAKKWLKKARDDYSGYLTETMIHFRVQTALDSLKS
ncbi:tetratricopeptide repeat protein 39B-like protein, partial [Leptotrombidium deliense]